MILEFKHWGGILTHGQHVRKAAIADHADENGLLGCSFTVEGGMVYILEFEQDEAIQIADALKKAAKVPVEVKT